MKYIEMTIEDALRYCKGNKKETVLVAVYDMEDECNLSSFNRKNKKECEEIIRKAETVAKMCDDFVSGLRCFSVKQDLKRIEPRGKSHTILLVQ